MASTRRSNHGKTSRGKSSRTKKSNGARTRPVVPRASGSTITTTVEAKPMTGNDCMTRQAIAEAAYFLWQQRGGNELVNWLEAEAMLKQNAS